MTRIEEIGYYEEVAGDLFKLMDEEEAAGNTERVKQIKLQLIQTKTKIDQIRYGI